MMKKEKIIIVIIQRLCYIYYYSQFPKKDNMLNLLNVDSLVNHLLRPPKFTYSIVDLGSCIFDHNNIIYERIDFHVQNRDNTKIQASLWRKKSMPSNRANNQHKNDHPNNASQHKSPQTKNNNIMIYLHCNCGSRVQSMQLVNRALQLGYIFVAFDSRGCGHSQGQYISLGYHQIWDLQSVIGHLHENYLSNPQIVLWGRSMGAVTAMNYLINSTKYIKNVKVAVLDSPFLNLNQVICEIVNKKIGVPKLLVDMFLGYIQPLIQQKVGFKISQFDLRQQVCKIECPLILMASKSDGLVPFKHLQQIYDSHHGRKSIFYLNQSHTDQRTSQTISKIFKAITRYFVADKKDKIKTEKTEKRSTQIQMQRIPKSPNIKNVQKIDLLTCRSSQFVNSNTAKKSCGKKIELTYPYSSSKSEMYTQFSIEKNSLGTEEKKKKLSLHHSKSAKYKSNQQSSNNIRATIHLYSKNNTQTKQKVIQRIQRVQKIQKHDKNDKNVNKYTAGSLLKRLNGQNEEEISHRRLVSNFYQVSEMDKENVCTRRFTAWQDTDKEAKPSKIMGYRGNH